MGLFGTAPFASVDALRLFAMMLRNTFALIILAVTLAAPAQAQDSFVPRLLMAKRDYLLALEVCLRRVIAASPITGVKPEHIATAAIKTCQKRDAAVRVNRKRVYGFPSVDNFMAGTEEKIFAFSLDLARAHVKSRSPRQSP